MLIAHHDQIPVLVGSNPAIEALINVGNAFVSRTVISVGGVCMYIMLEGEFGHEPHAPGRIDESYIT